MGRRGRVIRERLSGFSLLHPGYGSRVEPGTQECYRGPRGPRSLRPSRALPCGDGVLRARVTVTLKSGVLDPQGKAIEGALKALGIAGVASVRQGKVFDIELEGEDVARAEGALKDAAEKLLANPIIENYRIEVVG